MFDLSNPNSKSLKSLVLTAVIIACAPICSYASEPVANADRVDFKDLNVQDANGVRHLYLRIEQAANSACGTSSKDVDVMMRGPSPCVRDAVARAVRELNNPNLSQVFIEKNGVYAARQYGISGEVRAVKN
jgi:UrcA family protein